MLFGKCRSNLVQNQDTALNFFMFCILIIVKSFLKLLCIFTEKCICDVYLMSKQNWFFAEEG